MEETKKRTQKGRRARRGRVRFTWLARTQWRPARMSLVDVWRRVQYFTRYVRTVEEMIGTLWFFADELEALRAAGVTFVAEEAGRARTMGDVIDLQRPRSSCECGGSAKGVRPMVLCSVRRRVSRERRALRVPRGARAVLLRRLHPGHGDPRT